MRNIAVIGQGYVGLPLAISISEKNNVVFGIDSDLKKVNNLNSGVSGIEGIDDGKLKELIKLKLYSAHSDFSVVAQCSVVVLCVPTPLDKFQYPNLEHLVDCVKSVSEHIASKTLLIIESTIAPGTTRNIISPLIEKYILPNQHPVFLAYSPERIDPINVNWNISNTPKLVSGLTDESRELAQNFYGEFIEKVIICESVEIAETAKLLENTFRFVNISLINELAIFCNKIGVEIREVIKAASTKPYGFMPFHPSLGVGGHCIPVDPIYLSEKAREVSSPITLIDKAREINNEMSAYFIRRATEKIGRIKSKRVLILGLAYKPNISDTRESPVEPLINGLRDKGAIVEWHDDLVGEWNGEISVALGENYDLAILATPHDYFDLSKLGNVPTLDTRGSL